MIDRAQFAGQRTEWRVGRFTGKPRHTVQHWNPQFLESFCQPQPLVAGNVRRLRAITVSLRHAETHILGKSEQKPVDYSKLASPCRPVDSVCKQNEY
jgi:hypothetical protein